MVNPFTGARPPRGGRTTIIMMNLVIITTSLAQKLKKAGSTVLLPRLRKTNHCYRRHYFSGRRLITPQSVRLYIFDRKTNLKFLIDSGSDVSCLPVSKTNRKLAPEPIQLIAANKSKIYSNGSKVLDVDHGLRRSFKWQFILASIPFPIRGADLLKSFDLIIDLKRQHLIDTITNMSRYGKIPTDFNTASIKLSSGNTVYHRILAKFPDLIALASKIKYVQHNTMFYIETTGPLDHSRPRRLNPKLYNIVKQNFELFVPVEVGSFSVFREF
ncbi:transposon Ty3-G Gag-Pol polyprotein [Nephila pilipes]|uniref:Transposon Ty3-G Gag-Pol polyprotein n=1 Tax=Nephila pilipes TaxID=299642 RepID=A0A8X6PAN0_NEPPI|nr:transposon Ty3-G Gag-Pol polyprotein [Nephila pilipes]